MERQQKNENNKNEIYPINYVFAEELPPATYIGNDLWKSIDGTIYKVIG